MKEANKAVRVSIRAASYNDIRAMSAIENQSFESDRLSIERLRYLTQKAKAITLVATQKSVIAYAILLTPKPPKPARLYSIAVDARFRSQGVGALLVKAMIKKAHQLGYKSMRLEVRKKHNKTVAFYEKLGFNIISSLPRYYDNGDEGLRMLKYLPHKQS